MLTIIFEAHGTTTDNEKHISSGWKDVGLSELGKKQARELGERYKDVHLDAVFCSDLERSWKTGEIAFQGRDIDMRRDVLLRECDYGVLNGQPSSVVDPEKVKHIIEPFPDGDSYQMTNACMKTFIDDVKEQFQGKTILVIGHRATQYGLEYWVNGVPLEKSITAPWKWQPGWRYVVK